MRIVGFRWLAVVLVSAMTGPAFGANAELVAVRHVEGLVHGFLSLKTLDGTLLADGDLMQVARGATVTSRLVFHFKDGSLYDETTVFTDRAQFRLVSYHLVQHGKAFSFPLDMSVDVGTGTVTARYEDDHGASKSDTEHLSLPPDLSNGLVLALLKNVNPDAPPKDLPMVVATPKPRLVKLKIAAAGQESFSTAGEKRSATHYVLKVDVGGVAGLIAPLVGKQPPDLHVWILGGEAPAFIKSEQPLYVGGPVWRIELVP